MLIRFARGLPITGMVFAMHAGLAAGPADANAPHPAMIAWHCTQEADAAFHILCVPRQSDMATAAPPFVPTATARTGGASSLAEMRPVAQRGDAEVFSAPAWRLPLHSRPTDGEMVRQLLKSVLCGTHPACSVNYANEGLRVAGR